MQKIEIKYLGPIRELEMQIKDFNLLIGEQATGKSTVAKATYFFRMIKATITDYLCQLYDDALYNGNHVSGGFKKVIKKELKSIFISLFGFSWDLDQRLYLKYEYADDISIKVDLNGPAKRKYISVSYSQKLTQEIKRLEKDALNLYNQKPDANVSLSYASKERLRNYDNFRNNVNKIFDDYKETYYIPAGRSLLTVMSNNRAVMSNIGGLDFITEMFMVLIDNVRNSFRDGVKKAHLFYPTEKKPFDIQTILTAH